jgi:hypothetical protein
MIGPVISEPDEITGRTGRISKCGGAGNIDGVNLHGQQGGVVRP